jgi:hypothetical protein
MEQPTSTQEAVRQTPTTGVAAAETPLSTPSPAAALEVDIDLAPRPGEAAQQIVTDAFVDNTNGWIISDYEDEWGTVTRQITDGAYRWEIDAAQAVGRWCTPELTNTQSIVSDFYVSVDVRRSGGPDSAAYGLVLRHTEGSYYLFSVREDGFYQFSLWSGFAWQPIIDWTATTLMRAGETNHLTAIAADDTFELYINDEFVDQAVDATLPEGEAGLSISTAATDGLAVFLFDNFELWSQ